MNRPSAPAASYLGIIARPYMARFLGSLLLMRLGGTMYSLVIVLFALERFHSPVWAGLIVFGSFAPGLALGPLAGALLDRHGRVRLIALDMAVAAAMIAAILVFARIGRLEPGVLLAIVTLGAVTVPLTIGGVRALLPLLLPRDLWDRGNALDSVMTSAVTVAAPALGGILYATAGGLAALAFIGLSWLLAGLLVLTVREPDVLGTPQANLLVEALAGIRYLLANQTLRGLAMALPVAGAADGFLSVALPVAVLHWPGGSPAVVGLLWALSGLAAVAGGLLIGLVRTDGRESAIMAAGLLVLSASTALLAASDRPGLAALAMLLFGAAVGPFDVAFFSLRQRATDPAWFGRTITVSVSINGLGRPVGSAAAGPLVAISTTAGFAAAGFLWLAAAATCLLALPRHAELDGHA